MKDDIVILAGIVLMGLSKPTSANGQPQPTPRAPYDKMSIAPSLIPELPPFSGGTVPYLPLPTPRAPYDQMSIAPSLIPELPPFSGGTVPYLPTLKETRVSSPSRMFHTMSVNSSTTPAPPVYQPVTITETRPLSSMTQQQAQSKGFSYSGAVGWYK